MPNEQTPTTNGATDPGGPPPDNTTSSPAPDTPGGEQTDMFAGFDFGNMNFADEPSTKTEPSSTDSTEPPPKVEEPPPSAAAPKPEEKTPVAPPASQTPAPAPQQTPPAAAQPDPEQLKAQALENEKKALTELGKFYTLDEKTAERFETEPTKVLSEMLARAHLVIVQSAYQAVLNQLPQVALSTIQADRVNREAEDGFYKAWPVFKRDDPTHDKVLQTYGQLFRQQNPTASAEEFTKFVGAAAAAHLGLKMPAKSGNGQRRPVPHNPAAAGGGAPPASGAEPQLTHAEEMFDIFQSGKV